MHRRSGCPVNLTLETFGDRWSLIVRRDLMFGAARACRALLAANIEGIAFSILADRLARLVANGLLSRQGDRTHRQRVIQGLTEAAIDLVPMMGACATGARRSNWRSVPSCWRKAARSCGPPSWESCATAIRAIRNRRDPSWQT